MRVVSLVPSITESFFDLSLGDAIVGVTDYCIHPASQLVGLPRIGGTKNPRLADILALQPDVVYANQEENTPAAVNALGAAGVEVVVNFPLTVEQAVADLGEIATRFASADAAGRAEQLAAQVAAAGRQQPEPLPVFAPIWYEAGDGEWWMTFNRHTFTHDLLALCGFANVFAERERRYPLAADLGRAAARPAEGRDTRYPRLTAAELTAARPQAALLPSEPYAFSAADADRLAAAFGGHLPRSRIHLVDGSLLTWPGTRIGKAISALQALRQRL